MKPIILSAVSFMAVATAALAAPAMAQDVEVENAVARMVVIVENRSDIGVEIEPGSANLPTPTVHRRGNQIRIDGNLGRRDIRRCEGGSAGGREPGQGASVEVRDRGRVDLSAAPLIVVRVPRKVDLEIENSAVFGSIGRGASSVDFANAGCGHWTIANVDGDVDLSLAGSGSVVAGTSRSLDVSLAGSGNVSAAATGELDASIAGSGSISAAQVRGTVSASIAGSGDVRVRGDAGAVSASIVGSGDVEIGGRAASVDASIAGSGGVSAASVAGQVSQSVMGSGRVVIGR